MIAFFFFSNLYQINRVKGTFPRLGDCFFFFFFLSNLYQINRVKGTFPRLGDCFFFFLFFLSNLYQINRVKGTFPRLEGGGVGVEGQDDIASLERAKWG